MPPIGRRHYAQSSITSLVSSRPSLDHRLIRVTPNQEYSLPTQTQSVAFTSDLAQDYALSLLPIVDGSANLEIEQIVPVCQQIGLICGYEISVTREGSPYGYLILDASYPGF